MPTVFFTGYPGFIGRRLAHELLKSQSDLKIFFLVHLAMAEQAKKDFSAEFSSGSHELLLGDITKANLGLYDEKAKEVFEKTEYVFHLAALYDLTVAEDIARRVNVTGTQNIINFFSNSQVLKKINYVSTCYVAGRRQGNILPDMLDGSYGFYNFYESTKYEAEVLVKERMQMLPITIFRPAVVVGDSRTGETGKFDGPYVVMKLLHGLRHLLRITPNLGFPQCEANTIPVDYLVQVMAYLSFQETSTGKTYQVCDQNPPSTEAYFSELVSLIGGGRPYNASWLRALILRLLRCWIVTKITGVSQQALDYFMHQGKFRSPNLIDDLKGSGILLPHYRQYYPTLYRYMVNYEHRK